MVCLLAQTALAVNVSLPDTTGAIPGNEFWIPIYTEELTGLDVWSINSRVSFDSTVLTCIGVSKTGCVTSSWPNPTVNTNNDGEVSFAMYGTSPLSGGGELLYLKFDILGDVGTSTNIEFDMFIYNEGEPPVTTFNGHILIGNPMPYFDPFDDLIVIETDLVEFTVYAHDPSDEPITLGSFGLPIGSEFIDNGDGSAIFSWQTGYQDSGIYTLGFTVTDIVNQTDTLIVQLDVINVSSVQIPLLPYSLHQNVPNPFNPSTMIKYDLNKPSPVKLTVYDIAGRVVNTLINGEHQSAGRHQIQWRGLDAKGRQVTSGAYFYVIEAGQFRQSKRMLLLK